MAENKQYKLGKQIIHEDDLKFPVEYKGEVFHLRYPNPLQRSSIETEIARRLGGMPRESYSIEHITTVVACTYIDNLVVPDDSPDWFTSAWTCYDEELIGTLYAGYLQFRDGFQQRVREGGFAGGGKAGSS